MMKFAVFASGYGSNLQAIINAQNKGLIKAKLSLVLSDNSQAYALERAVKAKVRSVLIKPVHFQFKEQFDREVVRHLEEEKIDFIVLAGYMRILSPYLIKKYPNKILNIHPSLLPAFKGREAIKDAFNYGVTVTGATVHFVEEEVDAGTIVLQEAVTISPSDTLKTLEEKIHKIEHKIYPKAIDLFARGKLKIDGRSVLIKK